MFMMEMKNSGVSSFVCTDILAENSFQGPNVGFYRELRPFFPGVEIIASGGVTSVEDVQKLDDVKVSGVIVGRALLENKILLKNLRPFIGEGRGKN